MNTKPVNDTMKIRISQLPPGVHSYHLSCRPQDLDLGSQFTGSVDVDAEVDKTQRQLYLKVNIAAAGRFSCDRCIEEFELALPARYSMFYVYDHMDLGRYPADEVQELRPDTTHIDLVHDVREMILLSVPLKLLCREDCQGLCPHCGVNRNHGSCKCTKEFADPRWQGLEGLKTE